MGFVRWSDSTHITGQSVPETCIADTVTAPLVIGGMEHLLVVVEMVRQLRIVV